MMLRIRCAGHVNHTLFWENLIPPKVRVVCFAAPALSPALMLQHCEHSSVSTLRGFAGSEA